MKSLSLRATYLLVLALGLCTSPLASQCIERAGKLYNYDGTNCRNTVFTAVPFLRIVSDARSGAMGDAGLATSTDANAIQFNASKLAFAKQGMGFGISHIPWLRSASYRKRSLTYLSGFTQLGRGQAVGFGLKHFSLGDLPLVNTAGTRWNNGAITEVEFALAYAKKITGSFAAAITGKIIYSNLAEGLLLTSGNVTNAETVAALDLSFTYQTPVSLPNLESGLRLGLAFSNLGPKIIYTNSAIKEYLPANIGLGAAWEVKLDGRNALTLTGDVNKLMVPTPCRDSGANCDRNGNGIPDFKEFSPITGAFQSFGDAPNGSYEEAEELIYSVGLEYWFNQQLALRGGYFAESLFKGSRKYITMGMGVKHQGIGLNLSYLTMAEIPDNPINHTWRFSLLFDFDFTFIRDRKPPGAS